MSDAVLDTTGLFCPEPVMMLHKKVRDVPNGSVIEVIATDPSTERDIPRFCDFLGHELVEKRVDGASFIYLIRVQAG